MLRRAAPQQVAAQYERWPYPKLPILASIPPFEPWQLHLDYLRDRCGLGPTGSKPKIWIAGCGTQQPYVFSVANPKAEILASDLSAASLRIARWRCWSHGHFGVQFSAIDLNHPETWPDGPFDHIECYGVLMNLSDPAATLAALAERLAPDGTLRLMVYPWYSRRRIFQVQRVAQLTGISAEHTHHPALFRQAMLWLPKGHPLRYAVETYHDAKNDAGLVDGFLHAGDRGFTALELGQIADRAGLTAGWWHQRPWAQPEEAATKLADSASLSQTELLHALDLWQELRVNFTVCLVKKERIQGQRPLRVHPILSGAEGRRRYLGWWSRVGGWNLRSRTSWSDPHYSGDEVRELHRWVRHPEISALADRAIEDGVILGQIRPSKRPFVSTADGSPPEIRFEVGERAANPLYGALFDAYRSAGEALPDVMERWAKHSEPLEKPGEFGLTPTGTWLAHEKTIEAWRAIPHESVERWDQLRYPREAVWIEYARTWAKGAGLPAFPTEQHEMRELGVWIGSWSELCADAVAI